MSASVLDKIRALLTKAGVPFQELEHEPTHTSEESARVRGETLGTGAKAILMKTDSVYRLFVLPADRRVDSAAVKRHLRAKNLRFATRQELFELTGLVPGAVPPFGKPILDFELFCDSAVGAERAKVAFNAGSLTHSIIMAASDWENVAKPSRFSFSSGS